MNKLIALLTAVTLFTVMVLLSGCGNKGIPPDVKEKLDKYIGYWNTGHFDGIEKVLCPDYELLESPGYEPQKGIKAFEKMISDMLTRCPDFHLVVEETVYEKDKLAIIWSIMATNTGPGYIQPTGKVVKGKGISVLHLKDGKIKDEWLANNDLQWMTQLGFSFVPPKTKNKK